MRAGTHSITCPVCEIRKEGDTKHGFKLFALVHGVRCDAKIFQLEHQLSLDDFIKEEE